MSIYTVAHSPDADDIFMFYAIKFGWVDAPHVRFQSEAQDIETLNEKTLQGWYDISAISFALYPLIRNDYALLRTAASFGNGYGPKLIKKRGKRLKPNFKVALSGRYTTNALLFRIAYPKARVVYMNFLEIEKAVLEERVDAGVLIHESILGFDDSLEVEKELWDVWVDLAKEELPLPLGGMALRRSLPLMKAIESEKLLTKAVAVANSHKELLCSMLQERGLVRIGDEKLQKYLRMYANEESIQMEDIHYKALDRLFAIGYDHGYYDCPIHAKEYLIPQEYEELRSR